MTRQTNNNKTATKAATIKSTHTFQVMRQLRNRQVQVAITSTTSRPHGQMEMPHGSADPIYRGQAPGQKTTPDVIDLDDVVQQEEVVVVDRNIFPYNYTAKRAPPKLLNTLYLVDHDDLTAH